MHRLAVMDKMHKIRLQNYIHQLTRKRSHLKNFARLLKMYVLTLTTFLGSEIISNLENGSFVVRLQN